MQVRDIVQPNDTLLVVDAMTGQEAVNVATEFDAAVGLTGVVLTKIDGDARGGAALSVKEVVGKPILFAGTGEKLDEFEPFHPDRMASRILGMGDVLTLIEKAEATFDQEEMEKARAEAAQGPAHAGGLPRPDAPGAQHGPAAERARRCSRACPRRSRTRRSTTSEINRIEAIICSMTPAERRDPSVINGSRRVRIAKGSGVTPADVNGLLKQFKMVQQMMKWLGKGRMPKMPPGDGPQRARGPPAVVVAGRLCLPRAAAPLHHAMRSSCASSCLAVTAITSVDICRCMRIPMSSHARFTSCFVAMSVDSGARAMCAASSSTVASRSARGTTRFTSPMSSASVGGERLRGVEVLVGALPVHEHPRLDHGLAAGEAEALHQRHLEVRVRRTRR